MKQTMVHPKAKRVYCILGETHIDSSKTPEDIFIGLFDDRSYHILGCRPVGLEYLLPDARQSNDDWGTIEFPNGISDLEKMPENSSFLTRSNLTEITFTSKFIKIKYDLSINATDSGETKYELKTR